MDFDDGAGLLLRAVLVFHVCIVAAVHPFLSLLIISNTFANSESVWLSTFALH